jgi:hypothetical protein
MLNLLFECYDALDDEKKDAWNLSQEGCKEIESRRTNGN